MFNDLLTNQCQDHAAGDISDENYDQRRDYSEGNTPLRIRRLLAGGGYYVEANEGVETRCRAGENLTGKRDSVFQRVGLQNTLSRRRPIGHRNVIKRNENKISDGNSRWKIEFKQSCGSSNKCHSAFIEL